MLHKKQSLTVTNRRPAATFFRRLQENFERKFDGFPATIDAASSENVRQGATDANSEDIIDAITDEILREQQTPQCSDEDIDDCGPADMWGAVGWGNTNEGPWVEVNSTAGSKHVSDPINVQSGGDYAILTSYEQNANNAVGAHAYNLGPPFTPSTAHEVYMELSVISMPTQSASWSFRVGITGTSSSNNVAIRSMSSSVTPVGDYKCRVSVPAGDPPWTMTGKFWSASDTEPINSNMSFQFSPNSATGRLVRVSMTNDSNTLPVAVPVTIHITHMEINGVGVGSGLGGGGCVGKTVTEKLTHNGSGEFSASLPVDYYVTVWIDGLWAVEGLDYTLSNESIVLVDASDADNQVVTARYVVA